MQVNAIISDIKKRKFSPIYLLHGEESYYIDLVSDQLEHTVLTDAQKGFDQTVLYGKDTTLVNVVNAAKRYPMMSDYQVIVIKEAQDLKWKTEEELLLKYVEHLTPTTILVLAYKYGKFDKRKKLYKAIEKVGTVVESAKLYENKVGEWVLDQFRDLGRTIHPQAAAMMADYLGTDLSKIANEIEKLVLNVSKEQEIQTTHVAQNIGISKDFNVFELQSALAKRNATKAIQIVDYFAANPKSNPLPLVLGNLGTYFTKVLKYHYLPDKSPQGASKELGVHSFFVKEYELAARNFNRRKTFDIIRFLSEYDLKSKGYLVGPFTDNGDLLRELIFKILN
ncbi:DNA polymerase III subunit delta [Sphingobacterium psychroaquaticum]|uniref:DNA polymerase III subunit delta n=1 Tax=Sphingobacterium psychroaquaticum TaxID=561061 RepID=A0A1X7IX21_9SPHI|nr:DNA polymerase III subunit delta [Sphingobacterium psychroaquaticum]SMG19754.1 DNA polymerase III, delta subunit [Sphingobacterium psychroaquaticum]